MISLSKSGAYLVNGKEVVLDTPEAEQILKSKLGDNVPSKEDAKKNTIAYSILENHNTSGNMEKLKI